MNIKELFSQGVESHQTLNPVLWNGDELRPEVHDALLRIAKKFYKFLSTPVTIIDIIVTGSQANFAYTAHSDLDLHLIVDYAKVSCDQPVHELFDTKRKLWKKDHTIGIHGVPVEVYVEDLAKPVNGSSYSVLKKTWIRRPDPTIDIDVDQPELDQSSSAWTRVIRAGIKTRSLEQLYQIRDLLALYRRTGLSLQGEFGQANIVFKTLRNSGVIAMLHQAIALLEDAELSVAQD